MKRVWCEGGDTMVGDKEGEGLWREVLESGDG